MITEQTLADFHLRQQHYDTQQRWLFGATPRRHALDPRRVFARQVERTVADHIAEMGFVVTSTRHKQNYDLLVQGLRVEVKAAHWDGRRYQAQLRANDADVLVFCCINGLAHYFVIPFEEVHGKTVVEINRHDPRDIVGRWTRYYAAWDVLADLIRAGRNAWQPSFL